MSSLTQAALVITKEAISVMNYYSPGSTLVMVHHDTLWDTVDLNSALQCQYVLYLRVVSF